MKYDGNFADAFCEGDFVNTSIPKSQNLKGISAAAILGAVGGNPNEKLEVLSNVTQEHIELTKEMLGNCVCKELALNSKEKLHIIIEMFYKDDSVLVELMKQHTKITKIVKNNELIFQNDAETNDSKKDFSFLNIKDIYEFSQTIDLTVISDILQRQIDINQAISDEGLNNFYGSNVGKTLYESYASSKDVKVLAQAATAACSDARMGGCEMPVVINSGSGNQGITASMPVIVYSKHLKVGTEKLYRALCLSNLLAIYQQSKIGRLSAFCGVVSAATGSAAGIIYMYGGKLSDIEQVMTSVLANISGMVCDGAKASCAAKISTAVNAAILSVEMSLKNRYFESGDGIVQDNAEETLLAISEIANLGMKQTDDVIIDLMMQEK